MDTGQIVNIVDAMLKNEVTKGSDLFGHAKVLEQGTFKDEEGMWHVLIEVDLPDDRRYAAYDHLNVIEEKLEDEKNINVLLVPVLPGTATSA